MRRQGAHKILSFRYAALDETGTGNIFETDQAKTALPTQMLDDTRVPHKRMKSGIIRRIHYRINPANAVTYTLRLWARAVDGTTTPYLQEEYLLYESPAAQADDTVYDREVTIPFFLHSYGQLYFSLDWTGAPGNTAGIISVSGDIFE